MIYGIEDVIALFSAAICGAVTAGLIVDAWHRRQQPPPPPARLPAAEPAQAAAPDPATRAALNQATEALGSMRQAMHAYKDYAETLECSLAKARADAAEAQQAATRQEERAIALAYLHRRQTQEALAAGFTLVIDHGDPGRRHHPHREDPQQ